MIVPRWLLRVWILGMLYTLARVLYSVTIGG